MAVDSPVPHYLPTSARGGSEQGRATNFHTGTQVYAGTYHKVRFYSSQGWDNRIPVEAAFTYSDGSRNTNGHAIIVASWLTPKRFYLCPK